jgi:hypothetical protein
MNVQHDNASEDDEAMGESGSGFVAKQTNPTHAGTLSANNLVSSIQPVNAISDTWHMSC